MRHLSAKITVVAAFVALVSCEKEEEKMDYVDEKTCGISVTIASCTKAMMEYDEDQGGIRCLDILVFRPDGVLDGRGHYGDDDPSDGLDGWLPLSKEFNMSCTAGQRRILVFANCKLPSDIVSIDALTVDGSLEVVEKLKSIPMSGSTLLDVSGNKEVKIFLERWTSRIRVNNILLSADSALDSTSVRIDAIYVMNARSRPDREGDHWLNRYNPSSGHAEICLNETVTTMVSDGFLSKERALGTFCFYSFPNEETTERKTSVTCLVFRFFDETQGRHFYQHIELPSLKANYSYDFTKVSIKSKGGLDEWSRGTSSELIFSWTGWEEGGSLSFENGEGLTLNVSVIPEWVSQAGIEYMNSGMFPVFIRQEPMCGGETIAPSF